MAFRCTMPAMNWNAKDTSEIAINQIYSEHVEKEKKFTNLKTKYTANPFPSIDMNNGLGCRGARPPSPAPAPTPMRGRQNGAHGPPWTVPDHDALCADAHLLVCRAVPFVTEKVGYEPGLVPVEIGDDPDVNEVVKGLLDQMRKPTEKYSEPTTSSQEVGWFHDPLVPANPRFVHRLSQGEATKFAETYTKKMAGEHMFHGKSGKYLRF